MDTEKKKNKKKQSVDLCIGTEPSLWADHYRYRRFHLAYMAALKWP